MKRLHYIFFTLTILWMTVIFMFSSQTGETSSNTSGTIANIIISIFVPDFDAYSALKQQDILDTISFVIRKGAHFTEYAILGLLSFATSITYIWKKLPMHSSSEYTKTFHLKRLRYGIISLIFTCIYAISDEVHQGFVAERSPAVLDVIIDTSGGLVGILAACFFIYLYLYRQKKDQRKL